MTMKKYTLSFTDSIKHVVANPDRTAKRSMSGMNFDVVYQVWPNRASMLKTIDIQGRRERRNSDWRPCQTGRPT